VQTTVTVTLALAVPEAGPPVTAQFCAGVPAVG
jgi:hypothetical protein